MKTTDATRAEKRNYFLRGIKDGIPIALGYFAVSFALGINARNAGLDWMQAGLCSMLINASAGEYAIFNMIASGANILTTALMTVIANARYLLMSFAMSQKLDPKTGLLHRLGVGFDLTDELFGIAMGVDGYLNPVYSYGAFCMAIPGWSLGTILGVLVGNILPLRVLSALSVGLFGMFIAIIIPPAKKDRVVAVLIALSFALSYAADRAPFLANVDSGIKVIVLTVLLSLGAAILFPHKEEEEAAQ